MYQFQQKLKYLKHHIKDWNLSVFGNIFQEEKGLEKQMAEVQKQIIMASRTEPLSNKEHELQK